MVTRAHLGMLLWAVIVGLSFPAVGLLSEGMPPLSLTALQFAVAAAALTPFGVARARTLAEPANAPGDEVTILDVHR